MRIHAGAMVVVLGLSSCAHVSFAPPAKEGRIYDASEAVLKPKIIRWFKEQRIELQATDDPHLLVSRPKQHSTGTIDNVLRSDRPSAMGSSIALDSLNKTKKPVLLSSLSSNIYAVRVFN